MYSLNVFVKERIRASDSEKESHILRLELQMDAGISHSRRTPKNISFEIFNFQAEFFFPSTSINAAFVVHATNSMR